MTDIALTTVFTPPASCLDNRYTSYGASVYVKDVQVESLQCYPSGYPAVWSKGQPFSPAVCPKSYTVVTQSDYSGGREATAALCCPRSMTAHGGELGCYTDVETEIELVLPTGAVRVQDVLLAMHGVYIAWNPDDLTSPEQVVTSTTLRSTTIPSPQSKTGSSTSSSSSNSPKTEALASATEEGNEATRDAHVKDEDFATASIQANAASSTQNRLPTVTSSTGLDAIAPAAPSATEDQRLQGMPPSVIVGISVGTSIGVFAMLGLVTLAVLTRRRRNKRYKAVGMQDFDIASECQEDKRHWSPISSEIERSDLGQSSVVSEADSRLISAPLAELPGN